MPSMVKFSGILHLGNDSLSFPGDGSRAEGPILGPGGPKEPWAHGEPRPRLLTQPGKNGRARRGCQGRGDGGKRFLTLLHSRGTPKRGAPRGGEGQWWGRGTRLTAGGRERLFYLTD